MTRPHPRSRIPTEHARVRRNGARRFTATIAEKSSSETSSGLFSIRIAALLTSTSIGGSDPARSTHAVHDERSQRTVSGGELVATSTPRTR